MLIDYRAHNYFPSNGTKEYGTALGTPCDKMQERQQTIKHNQMNLITFGFKRSKRSFCDIASLSSMSLFS